MHFLAIFFPASPSPAYQCRRGDDTRALIIVQAAGQHTDAARELLIPIYGWFAEEFDTANLQEAKALLAELA